MDGHGSGWLADPTNPKVERYFDGTNWTDLTRPAQRRPRDMSGGGGGGAKAVVVAVVGVLVVAGGALAWYLVSGARDLAQAEGDLVTEVPAAANGAAMSSDVRSLVIAVETSLVENSGELPGVTLSGRDYVVTGANGDAQNLGAADGVVQVGITGTSEQDYCIWISAADGATIHQQSGGSAAEGACP
jgi:hypothetical protein